MSLNYILIDFENVQPTATDMRLIRGTDYRVRHFHGPHQNKFAAEMVKALQPLGVHLEYFQCERKGKNALDFHIAFYLGRMVQELEAATAPPGKSTSFFIVSKDSGFDVLLGHVRELGYGAARVGSVREALAVEETADVGVTPELATKTAPPKKAAAAKPVTTAKKTPTPKAKPAKPKAKTAAPSPPKAAKPDPWLRTIENLCDHPNNRPTRIDALERYLLPRLGSGTSVAKVKKVIARLQREGVVIPNGKKIEYKIPEKKK